jgi:prepilin-type processing-associated H-X9-DG protein
LLVVIAIIAILAAILFPVFAKARERAKQSTCVSNLKQVGTAISEFADDHDDTLPEATVLLSATPTLPTALPNILSSYVKSHEVFQCPSDSGNKRFGGFPDVLWQKYGQSYAYTSHDPANTVPRSEWPTDALTKDVWKRWRGGRLRSEFRTPTDIGLVDDPNPWHRILGTDFAVQNNQDQAGFNVLYCDGHVKMLVGTTQLNTVMGEYPPPPGS